MYAHVTGSTVDQIGQPPAIAFDGTRWWDLRGLNPQALAATGWLPVTETPRPADTATTTWDVTWTVTGGTVTQGWVERPLTVDEVAAREAQASAEAKAVEDRAILDATAALMQDAHEDGAAWVQPTGAHDAYPLGAQVTHNGKTWTSTTAANVWEPGVYGWV